MNSQLRSQLPLGLDSARSSLLRNSSTQLPPDEHTPTAELKSMHDETITERQDGTWQTLAQKI